MKIHEFLEGHRERWTKEVNARTAEGEHCSIDDCNATCWCLNGLIFKFYPKTKHDVIDTINSYLTKSLIITEEGGFTKWNDAPKRSFDEVLALCKTLDI